MIKNTPLWLGILCLGILLFVLFAGPYLPFIDQDPQEELFHYGENRELITAPFPPSWENPLGTDIKGRDLLSLIVLGGKETLMIILVICLIRYAVSLPLAVCSAVFQGLFSWAVAKWNQVLTNVPTLFMAILLINIPFVVFAGNRTFWVLLIIALLEVGRVSHTFQEQFIRISKLPYIEAGISVGHNRFGLLRRYYLPSIYPQIMIHFMLDLGKTMLLLGQLGFLSIFISQVYIQYDLGIAQLVNTSENWTQLLADSRTLIRTNVSIPFWISLAIVFTVVTFNLLGEGLRKHFEERATSQYDAKLEKKFSKEIQGKKSTPLKEKQVQA